MSFKIERDMTGRKFVVKLYQVRQKEYIGTFGELCGAIAHYFGIQPEHNEYKQKDLCPFCESSLLVPKGE